MKKIFFLFVTLCASTMMTFAQSDDGDLGFIFQRREKSNAFFLGPKVGGTLTTMTQPDEGKLYKSSGINFTGGIALLARFGKATENSVGGTGLFGVGIELKYRINSVKTNATNEKGKNDANLSIGYFEAPIYIHIYPFISSNAMNSFYFEAGVSISGTMSRSPKSLTLSKELNPGYSNVVYNIDSGSKKLKGGDIRPLVGIGYTIPNTGLDISARYLFGTSKLAKNMPCKMNSFELSLAWMFNVCKF